MLIAGTRWAPALVALITIPLAAKPLRAVRNRTDGPALNAALAQTGALLGAFAVLRRPGDLSRPLAPAAGILSAAASLTPSRMRIVRLEAIPIALPFRERYRTASGELDAREMVVLRLHTDSGPSGSARRCR